MFHSLEYIAVFLTGFVVTFVLTPAVRALAWRYNIVDKPDARRPHVRPTARGGGVAIVLGVHAACLVALFHWPAFAGAFDIHWWRNFVAASMILFIVGIVDDVRGLPPLVKLAGQAIAAILICRAGARFGTIFGHEIPWFLDRPLVVFWILAIINAFNLIDGLDGLASGLAIISATGLCGVFVLQNLPGNVLVLLALIGSCLAFLRYNLNPASIFMGDTGSMFLGFILGVVSLQACAKSTFLFSLTVPIMVLGVPIYDALLAIWRRSVRLWLQGNDSGAAQRKKGIMQPDLDHLHHRLVKTGISTKRVAMLLCVGNAALVVFGLLMTSFQSHASGIFLIALLAGVYVLMRHLALIELYDTGTALLGGLRRPSHSTLKAIAFPIWDMAWLAGGLAIAMWLVNGAGVSFGHNWVLDLPIWVTPTFSLLAISDTYVTAWARARLREVIKLILTLQLGLFLSLGVALLIDPYRDIRDSLMIMLLLAALCHPALIFARVFYQFIEEVVAWSGSKRNFASSNAARVILYGAGSRCMLFLRERGFTTSDSADGRIVVGLVDDNPALHFQRVFGYRVLGSGKDLERLVESHNLKGIVITATLAAESARLVREFAASHGLCLSEWNCREVDLPAETVILQSHANAGVI